MELARIDKPIGSILLFWPCCWGVALATPAGIVPDLLLMAKLGVGAFVMRGAGCTINDLWDRDFDKHVERTKSRPLARGAVTVPQALMFLTAQLSAGLGVLVSLPHVENCVYVGMASMPLVVAYPLMKRFTNYPQAVLGLTFNWGVLVGWTAVTGQLPSVQETVPLYLSGVCWTLIYDTIYGYQDRKDDKKLGLKSTSLHLGDKPQMALSACAAAMMAGLTSAGVTAGLSPVYYAGAAAACSHALWQIWTADIDDPQNLWTRFESNKYTGAVVTAAITAGHML
jgi:4-hydroxybenzoate polyprenyltransferase